MNELFEGLSGDFISAGIILIIFIIINKIVKKCFDNLIKKNKHKNKLTILLFVKKIISYVIYIIGVLIAFAQFDIFSTFSITILSALGVIATLIGLGLQDSLTNLYGSFELIFNRPFEVGDFIKLPEKNIMGTVEDISLRHTVIKTINNQREIVPNSLLNDLIIENSDFSDNEIVLLEEYSISYTADVEKAMEIVKEEIERICQVTFKGKNKNVEFPKVRVVKWDSSAIKLRAYVWGNDAAEAYDNVFELNKSLKVRFNNAGIEIPYDYINVINKK